MKIKNLWQKLLLLSIYFLMVGMFWLFQWPCVFKNFFGVPCPGCGMSHALLYLMRLDVAGAFASHPMFWSLPLLLIYYFKDGNLFRNRRLNSGVFCMIAAGFLLHWVAMLVKMFVIY